MRWEGVCHPREVWGDLNGLESPEGLRSRGVGAELGLKGTTAENRFARGDRGSVKLNPQQK